MFIVAVGGLLLFITNVHKVSYCQNNKWDFTVFNDADKRCYPNEPKHPIVFHGQITKVELLKCGSLN